MEPIWTHHLQWACNTARRHRTLPAATANIDLATAHAAQTNGESTKLEPHEPKKGFVLTMVKYVRIVREPLGRSVENPSWGESYTAATSPRWMLSLASLRIPQKKNHSEPILAKISFPMKVLPRPLGYFGRLCGWASHLVEMGSTLPGSRSTVSEPHCQD